VHFCQPYYRLPGRNALLPIFNANDNNKHPQVLMLLPTLPLYYHHQSQRINSKRTDSSAQPPATQPTAESPLPNSSQAKRTEKRWCKVELLWDGEENSSLLLSPLSYGTPSPLSPPPMPP
jgi:hypothetical protein